VPVETPEGIKESSAVREAWASASSIRIGLPESTSKTHIRGEALVADSLENQMSLLGYRRLREHSEIGDGRCFGFKALFRV